MKQDLGPIGEDERLGRRVTSEKKARRLVNRTGKVPHSIFVGSGKRGPVNEPSVDRLIEGHLATVAHIATRESLQYGGHSLRGWASLTPQAVIDLGLCFAERPKCDNPYHAVILLPVSTNDDPEALRDYAVDLTTAASWVDANQDAA